MCVFIKGSMVTGKKTFCVIFVGVVNNREVLVV